jgi:hypothetical protein
MEAGIMTCIGQGEAYIVLYPEESIEAKAFYDEHKNLFETAAQELGLSSEFLFSIVAPELTQYSYLRNRLETYSLKVLYVQRGKSYADFSIGYFQMKPSFIERLETYLSLDTLLRSKYSSYLFTDPEARTSRVERIDRLNTVAWQIKYLSLFCETVNRKFGKLAFSNEEEKLRFYASAYNCGFYKSEQQIKETEQKALFPHFSKQKFKYADISVLFYREIMNEK